MESKDVIPSAMGRPALPVLQKTEDWESLERLCAIQATEEEVAAFFKCSTDTICRRVVEHLGITFAEYFQQKQGEGRISLRRLQWQTASGKPARPKILARDKDGNLERDAKGNPIVLDPGAPETPPSPTMQIWLGKQYLNQSDREELKVDDNRRPPVTIQWMVMNPGEGPKSVDPRSMPSQLEQFLTVKPKTVTSGNPSDSNP